jgi:hypothetical protein
MGIIDSGIQFMGFHVLSKIEWDKQKYWELFFSDCWTGRAHDLNHMETWKLRWFLFVDREIRDIQVIASNWSEKNHHKMVTIAGCYIAVI